jgi:hypothetical protein
MSQLAPQTDVGIKSWTTFLVSRIKIAFKM